MLEGTGTISLVWKGRNIDIFKDGVSVPGLTMKYSFSNDCYFTLFNEKDKDLYYTLEDNNVGPTIHEGHEANLRNLMENAAHNLTGASKNLTKIY